MKTKIMAIALFAATIATVVFFPQIKAKNIDLVDPIQHITPANDRPRVDVVFVLDTTGSMSGLIQTAKDKIWSIAQTMASAQPTPDIRIGLVGYRDRGDEYVTRIIDLSSDLDSVYASLMDFQANGGGDGPESVNKALYDAVHGMSWSQAEQAYQVVFLVGDAPPHMDYQDEVPYPAILASAFEKGIIVNAIQCGEMPATIDPWQQIASLGHGSYLQVEQAGGAVAYSTPYDAEIAALSAKLDDTRLYFGTEEDKSVMRAKVAATDKLRASATVSALASRGAFNASVAGKRNRVGDKDIVEEVVVAGSISLDDIEMEMLPEALKPMAPAERQAVLVGLAEDRNELQRQIRDLADERGRYIAKKVDEDGGADDSLDQKLYDIVSEQAAAAGLEYSEGPEF